MYDKGLGVKEDTFQAIKLYKQAALMGVEEAFNYLPKKELK